MSIITLRTLIAAAHKDEQEAIASHDLEAIEAARAEQRRLRTYKR